MQGFKEILSSKGIKPTYQRLKLMKYLKDVCSHPTADIIYKALVREVPTISKTTVYMLFSPRYTNKDKKEVLKKMERYSDSMMNEKKK